MASTGKYSFFNNDKNPFKKNEKSSTVITKKGFVMFEENGEAYTPPTPTPTPSPTPTPTPIPYLLLAESGDALLAENGDNLEIQY